MWSIFVWVVIGGLAGWAASAIMNSGENRGVLGNVVLGVLGGFLGGFLIQMLGGEGFTGFNIWSFVVALFGAVLLIGLKRLFTRA
jgi:uncharacterized membrane protein YeaQ/YmgE (transglycosylase-associated protein family)